MKFALCSDCFRVGEKRQLEDRGARGSILLSMPSKAKEEAPFGHTDMDTKPSTDTGHIPSAGINSAFITCQSASHLYTF